MLVWLILPVATAWVRYQQQQILKHGKPLDKQQQEDARTLGIQHPEKVRLNVVNPVPLPFVPTFLYSFLVTRSWFPGQIAGMTLGYGINLHPWWGNSREIIAHELAHVAQYERLGGVKAFLKSYLLECLEKGYPYGPLEKEAIQKQRAICPPCVSVQSHAAKTEPPV